MSVLARDIDAYQRAVDQYRRQMGAHNAQIAAYNNSVVSQNDQPLVVNNGLVYVVNSDGTLGNAVGAVGDGTYDFQPYDLTQIEGSSGYSLVRKNPTATNTNTVTGSYIEMVNDNGVQNNFYVPTPDGSVASYQPPPGSQITLDPATSTFTVVETTQVFPDKPGDFTAELKAKKPDPTLAQMRKINQPALAAQERGGLIGDVIRGNGLAGGSGRVRGGQPVSSSPPADPPPTDPVIDPDPELFPYSNPSA